MELLTAARKSIGNYDSLKMYERLQEDSSDGEINWYNHRQLHLERQFRTTTNEEIMKLTQPKELWENSKAREIAQDHDNQNSIEETTAAREIVKDYDTVLTGETSTAGEMIGIT